MNVELVLRILIILVILLILVVAVIIGAIQRLGIGESDVKIFDDIQKKSAELEEDLIEDLHKRKGKAECIKDIRSKSVEIEKLLVDTAQLKYEMLQKHNIDRIKLYLTILTVLATGIAAVSTYVNYLQMYNIDQKEDLDKQFIELSQKVASPNQNEAEIAIITFPRFALPSEKKKIRFKRKYDSYDDFLSDFTQKYPYVTESTTIILNVLEKRAVDRAKRKCKVKSPHNSCEKIEEIYPYFNPPQFTGSVFSNTIISSLNSITKSTLQEGIILKDEADNKLYPFKREKISAVDLSEKDFRGAYLRNVDLEGINGKSVKLSFANLSGADLDHSYLGNSELVDTVFRFAHLNHCYLVDSLAKGADFTGAELENSDLRKAVLIGANFRNSYIANAKFNDAIIYKANFLGLPFENNNLSINDLIKLEAIKPVDCANFKKVRLQKDTKTDNENLPDFDGAIVDRKNYDNLDFLNKNYNYHSLEENDIKKADYSYSIEKYLINELKKGEKMGKLGKITGSENKCNRLNQNYKR